jgi:hypothetical protein
MSETTVQTRINLSESRSVALCAHGLQLSLSVAILSLDVYGVHYIPYNVLVSSLIVVSRSKLLTTCAKRTIVSLYYSCMHLSYYNEIMVAKILQPIYCLRLSCLDGHVLGC